MMKPTPTPWRVQDTMLSADGETPLQSLPHSVCEHCGKQSTLPDPAAIQIWAKNWGVAHCLSMDPAAEHEQHLANARHIVHVVNAYPGLIDTLRKMVLTGMTGPQLRRLAETALRAAKEEVA